MQKIALIAAIAKNNAIGIGNKLIYWLPNDLKRFKELTTGHTIIMGSNTFLSLPKGALPNRRNIVLSRKETEFPGTETFKSLEEALANPGSDADIVLEEGDIIFVPEYKNTVKISGNVLYANTVTYDSKMSVKDYIRMAGGYGYKSKRARTYVVYMNGTVDKARKLNKKSIQPGCEIIVPQKRQENNLQDILAVSSTSASIATMIATIGNILK